MTIFSILLQLSVAQARWAKPEEADAIIEKNEIHIEVNKNGTSKVKTAVLFKILKETAREKWGTLRFEYYPKNSKLEFLEASTKIQNQNYPVPAKDIVDSALLATENGFDEKRQVVISFPKVSVGSEISYGNIENFHKPWLEDLFSFKYYFGQDVLANSTEIDLESAKPLFWQINDPSQRLEFTQTQKGDRFFYRVTLKKPIFNDLVDEEHGNISESKKTWVIFSSVQTYAEMYNKTIKKYEDILSKPLPKDFEKILELAKKEPDVYKKINMLTSYLAENVRYMGDWRAVDGAFIPHTLEQIATAKFGDCKDFSVLIVKLLRELGLKASVAFVQRGYTPIELPTTPYIGNFNHAVAHAVINNKNLWIDGTNFTSFANGVMEDIAFRKAVVLDKDGARLEEVEWPLPEENKYENNSTTEYLSHDLKNEEFDIQWNGYKSTYWTGRELRISKEQIEDEMVQTLSSKSEVVKYSFSPFDLKSRTVEPIHVHVKMQRIEQKIRTTLGDGFRLPFIDLGFLAQIDSRERVSDYISSEPAIYRFHNTITKANVVGRKLKSCSVSSPWIDYVKKIKYGANIFDIWFELKTKKKIISAEDIQSKSFVLFQKQIRDCSNEEYLIYK